MIDTRYSKKNKFRVLLVYANKMMENLIPVNISVLSAVLKQKGFEVKLFDTTYYRTDTECGDEVRVEHLQLRSFDLSKYGICYKDSDILEDFRGTVIGYKPDIIGLSVVDDTYKLGITLLSKIKNLGVPTIVGGVRAVLAPEEVISNDAVDMVCIGEGENALVELCEKMHQGKDYTDVPGIWFKKSPLIIRNPLRGLTDLNSLPYLDFSIYERERFYRPMQGKVYKMLPVEFSRGCPFNCTYCAAPTLKLKYKSAGMYYRKKNIERVIEEIKFYKECYDLQYVYFTSETFLSLSNVEFATFASLYHKIKIPFWFQTRPETIKEDRIKILENIGCDRITIGIESGNERIRRQVLKRSISNKAIISAFEIMARSSIPVSVNNIIGIPDETREDVFDTIELNRAIKANSITVCIFTPYRGSHLRQYCLEKGYISEDDNSADIRRHSILKMPSMSPEEISGLVRTFPLYVKFPKKDFNLIRKAEQLDAQGDRVFRELSARYRKRYFS
ncbi:MAG TPA: radical SAM protein [Candidatus Omnitrophica bacterium]|nr:radical SAM protein [Candidatus Omnitrophota bacterium]